MNITLNTYNIRNEWEIMKVVGSYDPIVKFIKILGVSEIVHPSFFPSRPDLNARGYIAMLNT